ncbi:MAG TPA: 2-dehydropantoate 2-reductase [Longimicrobiales bacterium]|nr:2-dehydropantoate 2-reductase [Longimicrobiales bacterium]
MGVGDTVVIWGAGAIGGTIGAYLARAGHDIVFVDTVEEHVRAVRDRGLHITGVEEFSARAPAYTPDTVTGLFTTILLCVKAHHTAAATRMLAPHLSEGGAVVSVQNGLNEPVIAGIVGPERTVGCFVNFGADYMEPGVVHYGGHGAVVVGELDGETTPRIEYLYHVFQDFDEHAVLSPNVQGYLWSKQAYASMLFATAVTDDGIADVLDDDAFRPVITALAREVVAVATEQLVALEPFDGFDPSAFLPDAPPEAAEQSLDALVAFNRRSAKTHSGIWRDLSVRKRRTEVDAQIGAVVELGRQHGIPVPLNARLVRMIHQIEEGDRALARENLEELATLLPT